MTHDQKRMMAQVAVAAVMLVPIADTTPNSNMTPAPAPVPPATPY